MKAVCLSSHRSGKVLAILAVNLIAMLLSIHILYDPEAIVSIGFTYPVSSSPASSQ